MWSVFFAVEDDHEGNAAHGEDDHDGDAAHGEDDMHESDELG
jgi:hypothetical protein